MVVAAANQDLTCALKRRRGISAASAPGDWIGGVIWTIAVIDLMANVTAPFELRLSMRTTSFAAASWRACTEMMRSAWYSTHGLDLYLSMLTSQSHLRQRPRA